MGWNPNRIEMGKMEQIGIKRGKIDEENFGEKSKKLRKKPKKSQI